MLPLKSFNLFCLYFKALDTTGCMLTKIKTMRHSYRCPALEMKYR